MVTLLNLRILSKICVPARSSSRSVAVAATAVPRRSSSSTRTRITLRKLLSRRSPNTQKSTKSSGPAAVAVVVVAAAAEKKDVTRTLKDMLESETESMPEPVLSEKNEPTEDIVSRRRLWIQGRSSIWAGSRRSHRMRRRRRNNWQPVLVPIPE